MPRARARLLGLCLACGLVAMVPRPAAAWDRVQQIVRGTAETLEKGQLQMGIFAPITYGVTDALTVASHPIFDLLLLPNLDARYRLVQGERWVLGLYGGFEQGFLPAETSTVAGAIEFGFHATVYLMDRISITAGTGWAGRIDRVEPGSATTQQDPGVSAHLNATWLIGRRHLLLLNGYVRYSFADGIDQPVLTGALVRAWEQFQLVGGVSLGNHLIHTLPDNSGVTRAQNWPVMPYIDLWFDF
jgi:hypothetical protein